MENGADTERRPKLGSLDHSTMERMNITHHFNNDSKMSIQDGVVKKSSVTHHQSPLAAGSASIFENNQIQFQSMRPFAIGRHANADVSGLLNMSSGPRTIDAANMDGSGSQLHSKSVIVDVETPAIPNAMERLRQKKTLKKEESLRKKKEKEELYEKGKQRVLDGYKIKTIN